MPVSPIFPDRKASNSPVHAGERPPSFPPVEEEDDQPSPVLEPGEVVDVEASTLALSLVDGVILSGERSIREPEPEPKKEKRKKS